MHPDYRVCPVCEEKTSPFRNAEPMAAEEARSIKLHADFERYYSEREARREGVEAAQ